MKLPPLVEQLCVLFVRLATSAAVAFLFVDKLQLKSIPLRWTLGAMFFFFGVVMMSLIWGFEGPMIDDPPAEMVPNPENHPPGSLYDSVQRKNVDARDAYEHDPL